MKKKYSNIFPENDEINLSSISLSYIVSELQKYTFSKTDIDVKGKAYEEIVGSNLRGNRGEFFTPRNIARMTIKMLDIQLDKKILDPACGTGGFLVIGMNNVIEKLRIEFEKSLGKKEKAWTLDDYQTFMTKVREVATENFYGFDINPDLVKATKMNMVMNNDGEGNIVRTDSLAPPHKWKDEVKNLLCKSFHLSKGSIRRPKDLALFDFVVTNPPFGTKLPVKDSDVLEQYDLGHIWKKNDSGQIVLTDRLVTSRAPEVLFIERCYQLLRPHGVMAIVLPDAILGAPGIEYASIREWMTQKFKIIASIDLHEDTFQPSAGTQTSVIFAQKKTEEEIQKEQQNEKISNYNIFFAIADKIGYDKRGIPIYKRDNDGNELLFEFADRSIKYKRRIRDDQTDDIAEIFLDWKKKEGMHW